MKTRVLLLILALSPLLAVAQPFTITGKVVEADTDLPIPGVAITVFSLRDSTQFRSGITGEDGRFVIANIQSRGVKITFKSIGYTTKTISQRLESSSSNLGNIVLQPATEVLSEVEVVDVQKRAEMKGDTTQFNADAYKTNPDANAADLLKKIPGVEITNGEVKAQGEQVKRVLVDGRPFFGDDPQAALQNLPAQAIEKVEVFSRRSDQSQFTGFDDGEDEKTINIITRPSFRNGTFGRVFGGYGTDNRYESGGNFNNFKNASRLSIIGMGNNINQQNFGSEDLLGVVGTSQNTGPGGGRHRRGPSVDSDPNDFAISDQSGINTTFATGINYSNEWGNKLKLNTSYFFNQTDNENEQQIGQTNLITDSTNQFSASQARGSATNYNHRFNLRMEYKPNENNQIIFTPNASWQQNKSFYSSESSTQSNEKTLLNTSNTQYKTNLSGYNLGGNFLWMHRFEKRGRTFSTNIRGTASNNDGNTRLVAENTFFGTTIEADTLAQNGYPANDGLRISSRTRYTEPLGENRQLQIGYDYDINYDDANVKTYNFNLQDDIETSIDSNVSSVFQSIYQEHEFGLTYRYNTKKLNLGTGAEYQYATLESNLQFPQTDRIDRTFTNVQPFAFLRWAISKQKNLRLYYRATTEAPSVSQLQNVVNNSNPLQLVAGNPALKQSYGNRMMLRYGSSNVDKGTSFNIFMFARNYNNYITYATLIADSDTTLADGIVLKSGAQLRYPVNLNGYASVATEATWGLPVAPLLSNIDISSGLAYTRTPSLINNQNNVQQTYGMRQRLNLASNFSTKIDFNFGITANLNLVYNTLQPELNNNYYIQTTTAGLNYIFWKGVVLRISIVHQWYTGLTETFNQNFTLWNASVGKKIFKNQQGEVSLRIFDILNQNRSIVRNVSESYIQDVQTLVLQQYVMLTFTYNIKKFKEATQP